MITFEMIRRNLKIQLYAGVSIQAFIWDFFFLFTVSILVFFFQLNLIELIIMIQRKSRGLLLGPS